LWSRHASSNRIITCTITGGIFTAIFIAITAGKLQNRGFKAKRQRRTAAFFYRVFRRTGRRRSQSPLYAGAAVGELTTNALPTISISESPGIQSTAMQARAGVRPGLK
jgi:hypothetical protein